MESSQRMGSWGADSPGIATSLVGFVRSCQRHFGEVVQSWQHSADAQDNSACFQGPAVSFQHRKRRRRRNGRFAALSFGLDGLGARNKQPSVAIDGLCVGISNSADNGKAKASFPKPRRQDQERFLISEVRMIPGQLNCRGRSIPATYMHHISAHLIFSCLSCSKGKWNGVPCNLDASTCRVEEWPRAPRYGHCTPANLLMSKPKLRTDCFPPLQLASFVKQVALMPGLCAVYEAAVLACGRQDVLTSHAHSTFAWVARSQLAHMMGLSIGGPGTELARRTWWGCAFEVQGPSSG